jgi:hypothetical protein
LRGEDCDLPAISQRRERTHARCARTQSTLRTYVQHCGFTPTCWDGRTAGVQRISRAHRGSCSRNDWGAGAARARQPPRREARWRESGVGTCSWRMGLGVALDGKAELESGCEGRWAGGLGLPWTNCRRVVRCVGTASAVRGGSRARTRRNDATDTSTGRLKLMRAEFEETCKGPAGAGRPSRGEARCWASG